MPGCKDSVFRTYVDGRTGVRISMIVLYGPPVDVTEHTPENCYPHAGYMTSEGPVVRAVPVGGRPVPFNSMIFEKGEGGSLERQEVYYTWHYGRWTASRASTKLLERIPGIYKVHLARAVSARETLEPDGPSEAFLAQLVPEIERRLAASSAPAPPARPLTAAR